MDAPPVGGTAGFRASPGPPWLRLNRWVIAGGLGVVAALAVAVAAILVALALKPAVAIDRMVPASVDGYVAAYLDPSIGQKLNLLGLAHRFPDLKTDADITTSVDKWLDQAFAPSGITFSKDVRPWLGSQLDVVARTDGKTAMVAVLALSRDDALAKSALAKLRAGPQGQPMAWSDETYQGVVISLGTPRQNPIAERVAYALVDHTVVMATSEALLKDIIDTNAGKRPRLTDAADFRAAVRRVPADSLVFAYVNGQAAARALTDRLSGAGRNPFGVSGIKIDQLSATQTIAFALVAKPTGLLADLEVKVDPSRLDAASRAALSASGNAAVMTGWIPKRAYGFAATATLKASLTAFLDSVKGDRRAEQQLQDYGITGPNGVLAHLTGEAALEVGPGQTRYPAAAVLIGTTDRAGMEHVLQQLTEVVAPLSQHPTVQHTSYHGALITTLVIGQVSAEGYAPSYTVTQGFAIVASSLSEVEAVISAHETGVTIATTDHYRGAVAQAAASPSGLLYADLAAVPAAIRSLLPPGAQGDYDRKVAPRLGPITAVIVTSQGAATSLSQLVFVLITGMAGAGGTSA
jgi:hypothetical protein